MKIKVAHTPDADDAFMFYAMTHGKIDTWLEIEHVIEDIETLNRKAFEGEYEVTAISAHAYALLDDKYRILSAGASVGDGYGPVVVAKKKIELKGSRIAVPGKYTTANLLLKLAVNDFEPVEMSFDKVIEAVLNDECDAGLLIHEGQITYSDYGLLCILDLWEWWGERFNLPLPLGLNAIKRDLDEDSQSEFLRAMRESIRYALENVDEAIEYAMKYSRGLDRERAKKFALMYVNEYTYKMPESVVDGLRSLYSLAEKKGILRMPKLDVLE
ncbi:MULTISPECIES: MqnA/MqnD/SBP family protein [unclassified Archaeoglobus]|jgi:1,4-dihydroxy-6-naphthoate synthase|uniref:MqnA/MqnD/SBP family protein n=1 Tax=unclassified Archaeoglobus TaxID=2643606 RepID=UPI0025BB3517|nr:MULTISPECIES: MqnA/MqnD/SBP family protein [unclassified Archaeoglobus]